MRKISIFCFLVLLTGSVLSDSEKRVAPLLALWKARAGHENMLWMEQRVKMGDKSHTGYIQGTGGGDDAIMGFQFEENWDMLTAVIGYKRDAPEGRTAEFSVEGDGKVLYKSGLMDSKGPVQEIRVPIRGYRRVLLRITSERYNGTSGAAFAEPTLIYGLSEAEMKNDWSLSVNNRKTQLSGGNAPSNISLPFDVPIGEEVEYKVKIRRDNESRTVLVEQVKVEN